jgi:Domain of unknown function (DUF3291)
MAGYHIAQLNIARMKEPLGAPSMADFVGNLDNINALAECSTGFVWRLKDESGSAVAIRDFGDEFVVNMSVWEDVASLSNYAFRSEHVEIMRRRREWFHPMVEAYAVLWWVPTGHRPTVAEAKDRLDHLRKYGATEYAFTFKHSYQAPGSPAESPTYLLDDVCPAI